MSTRKYSARKPNTTPVVSIYNVAACVLEKSEFERANVLCEKRKNFSDIEFVVVTPGIVIAESKADWKSSKIIQLNIVEALFYSSVVHLHTVETLGLLHFKAKPVNRKKFFLKRENFVFSTC